MSTKKTVLVTVVVVALVAALAYVGFRGQKNEGDSFTVGAIMALTGELASYGTRVRDGLELAVSEINQQGGVRGRPLSIVYEDNQGDPTRAVSAFQKLIDVDQVPLIVGPMLSTESLATAPIANQRRVVQLSTLPGTIALSDKGDYVFRIFPSDGLQGEYLASVAHQRLGAKRAAIAYLNNAYGQGIRQVVSSAFRRLGGKIVADEAIAEDGTDFSAQLTKIREAQPDLIFGLMYFNPGAQFLAQAVQLGVNSPVLGGDAWSGPIEDVAGRGASLLKFSSVAFGPDYASNSRMQAFIKAFQARYGRMPTSYDATGFDAAYIVKAAVEAGGEDADSLKNALYKLELDGALGRIRFDQNGDNVGASFALFTMRNGKMEPATDGGVSGR